MTTSRRQPSPTRLALMAMVLGPHAGLVAQTPPSVELLGPGVISTAALEFGAAFSPSGDTLYFTRREARGRPPQIFWTTRDGDGWASPVPVSFGHPFGDEYPSISDDGQILYYASARPTPDGSGGGPNDLWFVKRTASGWSEPHHLGGALSTPGPDSHPVQAPDGLYFHSRRAGGVGSVDAWFAPGPHGEWGEPRLLPFNAGGDDGEIVFTPDGATVILYSDRAGGFGRGDLYSVARVGDGWGDPVNLGPTINTDAWEWTPTFAPDGRLVFARLSSDGSSSNLLVTEWPIVR